MPKYCEARRFEKNPSYTSFFFLKQEKSLTFIFRSFKNYENRIFLMKNILQKVYKIFSPAKFTDESIKTRKSSNFFSRFVNWCIKKWTIIDKNRMRNSYFYGFGSFCLEWKKNVSPDASLQGLLEFVRNGGFDLEYPSHILHGKTYEIAGKIIAFITGVTGWIIFGVMVDGDAGKRRGRRGRSKDRRSARIEKRLWIMDRGPVACPV